jgi:hypothetical protein
MSAALLIQQSMKGGWTTLTCLFSQVPSTMLPNVQKSLTCLSLQAFTVSVNVTNRLSTPIAKTELVQAKTANRTCLVGTNEAEAGFVWGVLSGLDVCDREIGGYVSENFG